MSDLPKKKDLEAKGDNFGFRASPRLIVGGLVGIVLLVFILSNRQRTDISFLGITWTDVPLWFALALTALLGAAAGAPLTHLRARRKLKRATR